LKQSQNYQRESGTVVAFKRQINFSMKLRKTLALLALTTVCCVVVFSCQKGTNDNASSGKAHLAVYLTDDPGDYDEVVIDVRDIKINYSNDTANGWQSLSNIRVGAYDVLKLINNKDTLLGDADLQAGKIQQIRLVLGDNNYVKIDGTTYPLQTPSAQQSGLKLSINQDVNAGIFYKLLLDFDASRSIVKTGNGKYILKPVIRTTLEAVGGSIKGFVTPDSVRTAVYAINGTDTFGTYTSNGNYTIRAVNAGSYSLLFVPTDTTYRDTTRTGITVTTNQVTVVDTTKLSR
jgi:hypothetical protein